MTICKKSSKKLGALYLWLSLFVLGNIHGQNHNPIFEVTNLLIDGDPYILIGSSNDKPSGLRTSVELKYRDEDQIPKKGTTTLAWVTESEGDEPELENGAAAVLVFDTPAGFLDDQGISQDPYLTDGDGNTSESGPWTWTGEAPQQAYHGKMIHLQGKADEESNGVVTSYAGAIVKLQASDDRGSDPFTTIFTLLKVDLEWQTLDGKTADEDPDDQLENFTVPGYYSDYSTKSLDWLSGLRYFTGGENQQATFNRTKINLKVSIPGLANQTVKLKAFDVDDTTPSDWNTNGEIDDSDTAGDDNNLDWVPDIFAGKFTSTQSNTATVSLDASGEAIVEFNTNSQPGSNYRVAVTLDQFSTDLNALQVSDSSQDNYVTADNEQISGFPGTVSPLLTVWRKLHIEVDSMNSGPPSTGSEKNFIEGTVASILGNNVDLGIYAEDYDQDAFEGGRLIIDGRPEYDDDGFAYYEVSAFEPGHIPFHPSDPGETTNVDIIRQPESSDAGKAFKLYDDDDAYLEMVGIPDSLPKDDESDRFINGIRPKYAPAFIEVVNANNMGLNPNPHISFKLNEAEITVGNQSHFDDSKDLNDTTFFWAHTLVFGYQPETDEDYDPSDGENPSYGGTPKTGILKDQSEGYSVVYTEMFREFVFSPKPTRLSMSTPSTLILYQNLYWNWALGTVAHEIGHSPGEQWSSTDHSEGGLMADGGRNIQMDFRAESLKRFRSSSSWSQ